jgi:hypothetical protein
VDLALRGLILSAPLRRDELEVAPLSFWRSLQILRRTVSNSPNPFPAKSHACPAWVFASEADITEAGKEIYAFLLTAVALLTGR